MKKNISDEIRKIWNYFKDEQVSFRYLVSFKLMAISFVFLALVIFLLYILLRIDLIFFRANQFPGAIQFQEVYFDFIFSKTATQLPYIFAANVFIFFVGIYLTHLILRPFKIISSHCEAVFNGSKTNFNPDLFSDHRLLILFSEYFFSQTDQMLIDKKFHAVNVPEKFTRIHKPVYDWSFFMNYFLIIIGLTVLSVIGILYIDGDVREHILILADKFLKSTPSVRYFLSEQFSVFDLVVNVMIVLHVLLHIFFGFYLYTEVSTPAFAIFSTMRSFLKGNRNARVHIIGYTHLREDCRKINRYLDILSKLPE